MEKKLPSTEESEGTTNDNQNENWSQRYIAHAPTGVFITDENRFCLEVNPAACAITEYTEAELLKMQISSLIAPEYQEQAAEHFKVMTEAGTTSCELAFVRKSGTQGFWAVEAVKISPTRFMCFTHDISARKQAEDALIKSEERFRNYFQYAPTGVFITDEKGFHLEVNPAASRITGFSEAELLKMHLSELTPPQYQEAALKMFTDLLEYGRACANIGFLHKQGGNHFWIVDAVRISPTRFMGFVEDITDRTESENSLRVSEEKFRKAFMTSPDGITITRMRDGMFISVNDGFSKILGYRHEDVLGISSVKLNIYKNNEDRKNIVEQLKINGFVNNYEASFIKKDGAIVFGLMSASIIELEGEPCVLSVTRDISERKLTEASLIESESRLRAITDSAQDAILMMDSTGAVCFWNISAERILGYTNAEAMSMNLHSLLAPQRYHEAHHKAFPAFLNTGEGPAIGKTLNLHALRKDGNEIAIELSLSAIMIKNEWHALGIMRDISDRIKADEELNSKTQELERFNNLMIGRELKMAELKREINELLLAAGGTPKYKVASND